MIFCHLR